MARTLKGTPPVEPQAFSRKDTGVALGIHERSVDRLVKTGALDAVKLGSRVVITRASIDRRLGK
jgi:hypothetical protein